MRGLFLSGMVWALTGCTGLTLTDQVVNGPLPSDYQFRTMIRNTADFRFAMEQNVGAIIEQDPNTPGQYRLAGGGVILPDNFAPVERILAKEDNTVFTRKLVGGSTLDANYASLGINVANNSAAELNIIDISRAEVPTGQIPVAKLQAYAQTKPQRNQYWIKSLLLTRILRQDYHETDANAKGVGPAFGAGGKVYSTNSSMQTDYALAAHLVDIDTYRESTATFVSQPAMIVGLTQLGSICVAAKNSVGKSSAPCGRTALSPVAQQEQQRLNDIVAAQYGKGTYVRNDGEPCWQGYRTSTHTIGQQIQMSGSAYTVSICIPNAE